MNIIFGDAIGNIPTNYTVLELDTFRSADNITSTAYCVVEKIPLTEFDKVDAYKKIHSDLIIFFRQQEWNYCEQAIEGLMGKWNGELDSFYLDLLARVNKHKQTPPDQNWNGTILQV